MSTAITVENISKVYYLPKGEQFHALKDVNLQVETGQVTGIIGPNGAGKSTLLKIISRITYPSSGRIEINGRLTSLLEVGTGFHPELSGRENIYLNGSILGMRREEIRSRFDEIVEFSGVDKFIDTPVKHFSSGMYVRLAFSVAAHLNSDILLIDEVLAVGDAEFQRKCLRKMDEATREQERTVLFVSHNMSVARSFCDSIAWLDQGQIRMMGPAEEITDHYLQNVRHNSSLKPLSERNDRKGSGDVKLLKLSIQHPTSGRDGILIAGERAEINLEIDVREGLNIRDLNFQLNIFNEEGYYLTTLSNQLSGTYFQNANKDNTFSCHIEKLPLMPGNYHVRSHILLNGHPTDIVDEALLFQVLEGDYYRSGSFFKRKTAGIFIDQQWRER